MGNLYTYRNSILIPFKLQRICQYDRVKVCLLIIAQKWDVCHQIQNNLFFNRELTCHSEFLSVIWLCLQFAVCFVSKRNIGSKLILLFCCLARNYSLCLCMLTDTLFMFILEHVYRYVWVSIDMYVCICMHICLYIYV